MQKARTCTVMKITCDCDEGHSTCRCLDRPVSGRYSQSVNRVLVSAHGKAANETRLFRPQCNIAGSSGSSCGDVAVFQRTVRKCEFDPCVRASRAWGGGARPYIPGGPA